MPIVIGVLLTLAGFWALLLAFGALYYAWPAFVVFGLYLIYKERNMEREREIARSQARHPSTRS